ncbi:helix-turn-helix domain-containing protein [Piscirickettsia salmonis]|uniref:helix-turn-helix domain-containing protein n=1 Tax=Piscirickettsia salmonis TaxID=1238 RepID=UPI001013D3A0|nr:helix-turn-helix domain-containing protein [Piscirickettsia salmonis]
MPSPYSYDLRIRALKMIDEGIPITQISKLLKISRDTLHRWKKGVIIQETSKQDLATKRAITIKSVI